MIKCNLVDLKNAINAASQVINDKATHAILQYTKIEFTDKLSLYATDLELGIKTWISAEGDKQSFCLHTKKLNELIAKLNPCVINLDNEAGKTKIFSEEKHVKTKINLSSLPVTDFPELPATEIDKSFSINGGVLLNSLKRVQYAASSEPTRFHLNGVLFELKAGKLNLVSTDGKRLCKIEIDVDTEIEAQLIVPVKVLNVLQKVVKPESELRIVLDEKQVYFIFDNFYIVSNIIDGNFPNYHQVIPVFDNYKSVEINVNELVTKIERVVPLVEKTTNRMIFDIKDNELSIIARNEAGDIVDTLEIQNAGEITLGLNQQYVLQLLNNSIKDTVVMRFNTSNSAVCFASKDDDKFIGLVMPMKITE